MRLPTYLKHLLADVLLWCVLFAFAALGARGAAAMRQYSAISLRYDKPLSGQAAYQARQYAIEHREDEAFWPTFWTETETLFSAELRETTARCIFYSGDASLVWPVKNLIGGMPGVTDSVGCAVSSGLAQELWGDVNIIGKTVEAAGTARIIRCVFDEAESLALLSVRDEDMSQSFTSAELAGGPLSPDRSSAERFAAASGLGTPDSILMSTPAFLATLMSALPIIIFVLYGLILSVGWLRKRSAIIRRVLMFLPLIGVAMLLPRFLEALPDRVVPTQWSDFSFWGSLFRQTGENLREYLELSPSLKDVIYASLFFKQIGIAFAASVLTVCVCFRRHTRMRIEWLEYSDDRSSYRNIGILYRSRFKLKTLEMRRNRG